MSNLPPLDLYSRNLYGTIRYFPNCKLSTAICKVRGKKTLLEKDIETLNGAGFPFVIYDEKGEMLKIEAAGEA